jgi:hypothetical protein
MSRGILANRPAVLEIMMARNAARAGAALVPVAVGFGRIVVSEIEVPILLVNLV